MATTTLRSYLDDLEHLLDQEALEEVIGHCKYILTKFPKNLAVYRLYGRALLGKSRHDEAQDIFERVLSAAPNDFAAHVSMSEIFQEQGDEGLTRAIWHLERAFEQDPNNPALQDEMRRLYDLRDGHAPESIQLTRGALAQLYYKGQLYDQAVAELNAALRAQPDRPDLLLLLAESQWDNHRPVEAGETALRILQNFPYSLDANRLLAKLWLQNGRPSDAKPFLERLGQVDPFAALELVKPGDQNAANGITIQRLDWNAKTSAALLTSAPDWISGVDDVFGGNATPESVTSEDPFGLTAQPASPDWMQNFTAPTDVPVPKTDWFSSTSAFSQAAQKISGTGDLPDWFADINNTPQPSTAPPAQPAIPSWLEGLDAPEPSTPQAPAFARSGSEMPTGFTDLLNEFNSPAASAGQDPTGFTDLLNEFEKSSPSLSDAPALPSWLDDAPIETAPPVPSWLNEPDQSTGAPAISAASDLSGLPDWLSGPAVDAAPAQDWLTDTPAQAEVPVPDWLNDAPAAPQTELSIPDWVNDTTAPQTQVPIPDWMSEPEPPQVVSAAAPADELLNVPDRPAEPASEIPSWLNPPAPELDSPPKPSKSLDEIFSAEPASEPVISEFTNLDALPNFGDFPLSSEPTAQQDWLSDQPGDTLRDGEESLITASDMPDWMNDLPSAVGDKVAQDNWALGTSAPVEPAVEEPVITTHDTDSWLTSAGSSEPVIAHTEAAAPDDWSDILFGSESNASKASEAPHSEQPASEAQTTDDWLASLQDLPAAEPAPAETASEPVDILESMDWLNALPEAETTAATETPAPQVTTNDEDWLSSLRDLDLPERQIAEPVAQTPEPASQDPLDWMSDLSKVEDTISDTPEAEASVDWLNDFISEPAEPAAEVSVPSIDPLDWMSAGPDIAHTPAPASEQPVDKNEAVDLDDWMSHLPPIGESTPEPAADDDWLRDFESEESPAQSAASEPASAPSASAEPPALEEDWLTSFEPENTSGDMPAESVAGTTGSWLDDLAAAAPREPLSFQDAIIQPPSNAEMEWGGVEEDPAASVNNDDWLSSLGSAIKPSEAVPSEVNDSEIPEWMRDMPAVEAGDDNAATEPTQTASKPGKRSGMTDLLDSLRLAKDDVPAKRNTETGVLQPDAVPDWMNAFGTEDEPAALSETKSEGTVESIDPISWLTDIVPEEPDTMLPPVNDSATPDWLQETHLQDSGTPEFDFGELAEAEETGTPDWLEGIGSANTETPIAEGVDWSEPALPADASQPAISMDDVDIDALLGAIHEEDNRVAKDEDLVNNTSSVSSFKFERVPAWLRKKK